MKMYMFLLTPKKKCTLYIYICSPMGVINEFSAVARVMQSSSKELSTLVADRVYKYKNKRTLLLLFLFNTL